MTIAYHWLETQPGHQPVFHRYVTQQEAQTRRLMVFLPGWGYTNDMPILFYLRDLALRAGWDTLSITYAFQAYPDQEPGELGMEVQAILNHPDRLPGYRTVCYVGKSLGTPLAIEAARQPIAGHVRLILLTPILNCTAQAGPWPTLAIIGTHDSHYSPELLHSTHGKSNVTWCIHTGLDHSLQVEGDHRASLSALANILDDCAAFMKAW